MNYTDTFSNGDDTDTIGAVAGAVAGTRFRAKALPRRWLTEIGEEDELRLLATKLVKLQSNNCKRVNDRIISIIKTQLGDFRAGSRSPTSQM